MSRATVREALPILEVQNLVRVKAGRAGGAFVQRPTTKSIANSVGMLIRGRHTKLADLMEAREALEPFCAELAARNRTNEDLAVLDRANEGSQSPAPISNSFCGQIWIGMWVSRSPVITSF
ncbi:MAG: GntR family transcriptional regulator, transcriptional repressor for pyruvate dehydrogenase complex [Mycobacterium sp.]|jgi:DNA-binding FadR family transcriptional regulator|nr:GntR family transcriptional regulator, transcriptional repressor for pyruvate dehydrogenase complex [Mycobacterium sp.]